MKVVVIGNGIAGFSAASTLRQLDRHCHITMISTESNPLYSPCVLADYISGDIPSGARLCEISQRLRPIFVEGPFWA